MQIYARYILLVILLPFLCTLLIQFEKYEEDNGSWTPTTGGQEALASVPFAQLFSALLALLYIEFFSSFGRLKAYFLVISELNHPS